MNYQKMQDDILQYELNALAVLKQEEADTADHSIFNNLDAINIISRYNSDTNLS